MLSRSTGSRNAYQRKQQKCWEITISRKWWESTSSACVGKHFCCQCSGMFLLSVLGKHLSRLCWESIFCCQCWESICCCQCKESIPHYPVLGRPFLLSAEVSQQWTLSSLQQMTLKCYPAQSSYKYFPAFLLPVFGKHFCCRCWGSICWESISAASVGKAFLLSVLGKHLQPLVFRKNFCWQQNGTALRAEMLSLTWQQRKCFPNTGSGEVAFTQQWAAWECFPNTDSRNPYQTQAPE